MEFNMKKTIGNKGVRIALTFLLLTWIILLLLLIFVFTLRLKGYTNFNDWWTDVYPAGATPLDEDDLTPAPTSAGPLVETITPAHSVTQIPTITEAITITPTTSPVKPTESITEVPDKSMDELLENMEETYGKTTKEYGLVDTEYYTEGIRTTFLAVPATGEEQLDATIKTEVNRLVTLGSEHLAEVELESTNTETALVLNYDSYHNENYVSIVFHLTEVVKSDEEETRTTTDSAKVYSLQDKDLVTASKLFKESYFSILKERLAKYVTEHYSEEFAESEFILNKTPYNSEDYQEYYIKEDKVYFLFGANTLTELAHTPFTYEVSLEEALPFMNYALDGTPNKTIIRELDTTKKMVALTFDDGPFTKVDEQILKSLEEHNAKATFFVVGERLAENHNYITTMQEIYAAGHEVGSHMYSHQYFNQMKENVMYDTIWYEANETNRIIAEAIGHAPDYVRMPGGAKIDYMKNMPFPMINWSISSDDWDNRNRDKTYQNVIKGLKDGDIVLMHSLYQSTAEALDLILDYLDENNYQAVTLSELFYYKGITPENGETYRSLH